MSKLAEPTNVSDARAAWFAVIVGALALVCTVTGLYSRVLHAPLLFDDDATIVKNPSIFHLWPLFGSGEDGGPLNPTRNRPTSARPLVNLSLAINYHFHGTDAAGYHAVNIALHALSTLLLWAIVRRILRLEYFGGRFEPAAGLLSFAAALVWSVHPLNTESVAYITQRTESMMGFFYLAVIYASLRYWDATARGQRTIWLVVAGLAGILGMLSKEMMASSIAMVLLLERTFVRGSFFQSLRQSWPLYVALTLGWLPILAINYHGPRTPLAGFHLGVSAPVWWLTQTQTLLVYLKLTFWPWPLVIHYEVPYLRTIGEALPSLVPVAALLVATLVLVWRQTTAGFILAWFFAVLSPTLLIPLPGETLVERRMYVPLMAIVPLAVIGLYAALARCLPRSFVSSKRVLQATWATLVLAVVAIFGSLTFRRLDAYQSELAIWEDAVLHQPHDPLVQVNLGTSLAKIGRADEAMVHFERALLLDPENERAHFNLGRALAEKGQIQQALPHFEAAILSDPKDAEAQFNWGQALIGLGRTSEAIEHFQAALQSEPKFGAARNSLGIALASQGRISDAIPHLEQAVKIEPDAEGYVNLLSAYALANRPKDAITAWNKAIELARSEGKASLADELAEKLAGYRAATAEP